ncbi:hypothetical protein ACCQ13_10285 [Xanthomonas sp. NCPPB 1638]|uniref:hypothetical protein n=1 Tax=Xanthomonas TaxID=338 RepID=UPI00130482F6|nr:hypothetical protein [Xanthomonas cucurbitae]WDM73835.1 hypothetical protein K6982_10115 [Xanthomonas cucurbitae]WDM84364.1 hypothetical protein K6979_08485 [Xanthomonas cucurbitae]
MPGGTLPGTVQVKQNNCVAMSGDVSKRPPIAVVPSAAAGAVLSIGRDGLQMRFAALPLRTGCAAAAFCSPA